MSATVETLNGAALSAALPELAALRIAVFRAYPYLYEGDPAYEARYLTAYVKSPGAIVVGAFVDGRLVGAATGAPMEDHAEELAAPFAAHGYPLDQVFYFGESVLLPEHRGRGIGHAFFDHREAQARALGRRWACFCAVVREPDDPRRPPGYTPLDPFWRKRGYAPVPGLEASFAWPEVGSEVGPEVGAGPLESVAHQMQFWMRTP